MKEIMGGLWCAGLVCWAIVGFWPSVLLFILGLLAGAGELVRERQAVKQAASWRRTYPPYGY